MVAHAFLVVAALTEQTHHPPPSGLIGLTCNEVQHLFATLVTVPLVTWAIGCAGRWRRRHQARARTCHHQRQATQP
jgi:hypothetical protein